MLRELITYVLNNYLGKYIENLNTQQLLISLLNGEVELENLPLRRDALRNIGLPLKIHCGSVGKIKLQVPVRQFRTAPWCINIENVMVVCGPINMDDWDADEEEQADLDYKLAGLDRLEAKWRAERETAQESGSYYASSYTGWLSYGTSLVTNIVENLQLRINNVHIRYEDSVTVEDQRFACGVTIESLSAQTCDANWLSGFTANVNQSQHSFKLVELQAFSFYWDTLTNEEIFGTLASNELAEAMEQLRTRWQHEFVISPVSATARLKRDRSEVPLRTRSRPRLVCDLLWNEIALTLSDLQYNQMVSCTRGLDDIARFRRYRLLRPRHPVKESPKAWWLYFIRCHGIMRTDKAKLAGVASENLQYIKLCTKVLLNPNILLTLDEKEEKERIERERDYEDLKFLRELCLLRVPNVDDKAKVDETNQGRSMLVQWFPHWLGWYGGGGAEGPGKEANGDQSITETQIKDQVAIEDELLNALSDTVENNSILKRDAVFGKFEFTLKRGTFDVCSNKIPMLQLQFENLILNVETRPRSGSHFVGLSLGSICVRDRITPHSEFPDLIKPQQKDDRGPHLRSNFSRFGMASSTPTQVSSQPTEPLFLLEYEKKPLTCNTDSRLLIKSQSLDIVYNTGALTWIVDFIMKPHLAINAKKQLEDMKNKTKAEFIKNWESMLEGHLSERKIWTLEIDISAPQIIFVENFCDRNDSLIVVIDFGRLQLTNQYAKVAKKTASNGVEEYSQGMDDEDEDEAFMTPCSTPPGSPSLSDSPTLCSALSELPPEPSLVSQERAGSLFEQLDEGTLHNKLYDRYNVDLTDLQVLVCKGAKERWGFASSKGYSTMHVLDRFCISLQIERRIINTLDPQFPSLTLSGTLPKLNAHVNEQKISALLHIFNNIFATAGSPDSPFGSPSDKKLVIDSPLENADATALPEEVPREYTKIVFLQFAVDQMSLEVQSRGRSIAELQVTGVKAGFSQRAVETNFTLSVHGLLLVDAMQSFGPDFELLVASHKHVGMDSVSGSLRQSEPVSPCSPGSPDPHEMRRPTSPMSITKALSSLQRANSSILSAASYAGDLDALITVEVMLIKPTDEDREKLHIANIQFNNLDIIANQETIVELLTFVQRVFPKSKSTKSAIEPDKTNKTAGTPTTGGEETGLLRTEITFDFHRLNVLILRAVMRDTYLVGRKVGTFTMSEAKIHATLGSSINVEGSLGGLQVLDLTPDGINHQRILSVGKDPLTDPPTVLMEPVEDLLTTLTNEIYGTNNGDGKQRGMKEVRQALSFNITRDLNASVTIKIRMASVWYTHCARFMQELSWCATEFKHYLKTLARSIRDKATDMALGLVQPLPNTPKPTDSMETPKHKMYTRQRTESMSKSRMFVGRSNNVTISLDIILDTPVLVLPRSSASPQVFVAHLGKMTLKNNNDTNATPHNSNITTPTDTTADSWRETVQDRDSERDDTDFRFVNQMEESESLFTLDESFDEATTTPPSIKETPPAPQNLDLYIIHIRNINFFSLDTTNRKGFRLSALPRAEEFYSCQEDAIPVIHDTAIKLEIERHLSHSWLDSQHIKEQVNVNGSVIKPLRLSLTRQQYEQLLDTIDNIFKIPTDLTRPPTVPSETNSAEVLATTEEEAISFKMDPKVKRRLFSQESLAESKDFVAMKIFFELPTFIIELNNQKQEPLVEISFRDFIVCYDKHHIYETKLKVSLKSLLMEDLLRAIDSKHRIMVISSAQDNTAYRIRNPFISNSCPDLVNLLANANTTSSSLPDNLSVNKVNIFPNKNRTICPDTPPPSPQPKTSLENLVIYTSELVDPDCPNFVTHYNSMRQTSFIDFNSLDLVVSVESWFVVLNFFGLLSDNNDVDEEQTRKKSNVNTAVETEVKGNTELNIEVRSLTLVLIKPNYELAKANVSNAHFIVSKYGQLKTVDGRLGSISLVDLTSHGCVYREKFMTSGNEALNFGYTKDEQAAAANSSSLLKEDAKLKIQMSSVRFIYTKRFISEIQEFFQEFSQLQMPVIKRLKTSDSKQNLQQKPFHLLLEIKASSPIILLPLSARSDSIIVGDLGEFTLKNSFHFSNEEGIISVRRDTTGPVEILDVMSVKLFHTDLFAGLRCLKSTMESGKSGKVLDNVCLDMGNYVVVKKGAGLLKHKCHLKLIVERNIDSWRTHNVPDISVHGTLSKLESVLDLQQYKLIRGFLAHNLGEDLDDLCTSTLDAVDSRLSLATIDTEKFKDSQVWKNLSIALDLQDVSVRLDLPRKTSRTAKLIDVLLDSSALACINFIKSRLIIDSFSDGSQDIDLVSQEILILDSRIHENPEQANVFTNILKPIHSKARDDVVQAEVHSRRRRDHTKYTILLNDMRVMAVLDWLETVKDFLAQSEDPPPSSADFLTVPVATTAPSRSVTDVNGQVENAVELKLNITDSEVVFVENTNQRDTNAIILKSTTVLSFRPYETNKIMSINLNNLEVFSCSLDAEEETALSIIDPVIINLDIKQGILEVHMQKQLCIRLSYNDVRLMQQMMKSLEWQSKKAAGAKMPASSSATLSQTSSQFLVAKLMSLGFRESDCENALTSCDNEIDDAALWLTKNAEPTNKASVSSRQVAGGGSPLDIIAVDVKASCISICVIDDCKNADVPLLEFSLSHLNLRQELGSGGNLTVDTLNVMKDSLQQEASGRSSGALSMSSFKAGYLSGVFSSDYYNRALSGWEPVSEPWKCEAAWSYSFGQSGIKRNRLHLKIDSMDTLRLNVTSTLIELYEMVKENWIQDYYAASPTQQKSSATDSTTLRRRTPFIPFALKNETGIKLWFTTLVSSADGVSRTGEVISHAISDPTWQSSEPGESIEFSFGKTLNKKRHHDSHKLNLHQIHVHVDGWQVVGPVSVDKVGVFFRHAKSECGSEYSPLPRARIVFAVTSEGAAQKLITVRSSLKLHNKLDNPILLKMEHLFGHLNIRDWPPEKSEIVNPSQIFSIPLSHVHAFLYVKPLQAVNCLQTLDQVSDIISSSSFPDSMQKFDGNEYWNKYENFESSRSSFRVNNSYHFTEKSIHWKEMADNTEGQQELRMCRGNRDKHYRLVVAIRKDGYPSKDGPLIPGHTLIMWPPLRIHNLLPCDLLYEIPGTETNGRISTTKTVTLNEINLEQTIDLNLTIDSYPGKGSLQIPQGLVGTFDTELRLRDVNKRVLQLKASVQVLKSSGIQITISAPFLLINRTGLPLIYRQEGVPHESAGQFSENEQARQVSPFMYSFSDPDGSPALIVRLGKRYGVSPPWCQPFNLHKDILHRQLKSVSSNETFIIGIEVRRGRGRYSQTTIVTFSPRFQLYNQSSYKIQIAQKCFARAASDGFASMSFIEVVPGCNLPFHWPRLDMDQELCIRLPDVEDCMWSGGIPIQETQSLYINIRNINGAMNFLRMEIVLQGATYYMLFGNAEVLPPPIRLDNFSEVPIQFYQPNCRHEVKTVVRPHSSMSYVLDEPMGMQCLQVEAPGGDNYRCLLGGFDDGRLTYENFIYIAFSHTFEAIPTYGLDGNEYDVKSQQLVLGMVDGKVVLTRKQAGDRSQLWRMNNAKQLEHEGSSPPTEPGKKYSRFVLDLEKPPQPTQNICLVVRPSNPQRKTTQTWRFTEQGRLMCEHSSLCVQAQGGLFGLRPGSDAVLGMIKSDARVVNQLNVPFEQAIERQKLRPGSGCLSVTFQMDGPIKTIQIKDIKNLSCNCLTLDSTWKHVSHILSSDDRNRSQTEASQLKEKKVNEYHINLNFSKGIGVSVISRSPCEELIYISLETILLEFVATPSIRSLDLSVGDLQIDNQLFETQCPVLLYTIRNTCLENPLSAVQLNVKMLPSPNTNAVIFEHLILSLRPMALYLEERLMLRLADFLGFGKTMIDPAALPDESDFEAQRVVAKVLATNADRYYFGNLQIVPSHIRLSVITASKLSPKLTEIKKSLGLTLIKFEDAVINFNTYSDKHHFETHEAYLCSIKNHYKNELKWQAAYILGSVDFLGNPIGFANDLSEGFTGLFIDGSITSLVKNVTHGISNSTAKLTETLSDGLGRVVLDDQYTETRMRILEVTNSASSTGDHLVAGLKGFGYGLLGGVTSLVKHTYNGAQTDGFQGFISGIGRGLVGTVTKPVIGMLDLASETANAVKETSKSSNRILPDRKRLPRCVTGAPGGLFPAFSTLQGKGQQYLFLINKRNFQEQFMAYEPCLFKDSQLRLLVSTENLWVFSRTEDTTTVIFSYHLSELLSCHPVSVYPENSKSKKLHHYIELCLTLPSKSLTPSAPEMVKRPRVRCQNEEIAQKASRHINYAKGVYDEREQTLISDTVID